MNRDDLQKKLDIQPFSSMNQIVYEQLFEEIISLRLAPGSKINEMQLAKDIGISRSPVKMAIERLCKEGLVEKLPGKVSRVSIIELDDCMQLCEVRKGIEGEAAFLAAKRASKEDLSCMKALLQKYEQGNGDSDKFLAEIDCQFHQLIINASNNKYIKDLYECIRSRIGRYRRYVFKVTIVGNAKNINYENIRSHRAILHALENGYSAVAREEMIQDIEMMRSIARYLK